MKRLPPLPVELWIGVMTLMRVVDMQHKEELQEVSVGSESLSKADDDGDSDARCDDRDGEDKNHDGDNDDDYDDGNVVVVPIQDVITLLNTYVFPQPQTETLLELLCE